MEDTWYANNKNIINNYLVKLIQNHAFVSFWAICS